jgi:molybdopterin/thiamine biosynthesis adenylyltransferase/proteasome lid subunit RPN8/RPN11
VREELTLMTVTVVFPQQIAHDIDAVARLPVETAGVLLASIVVNDAGDIRLLARKMHWVPEPSYLRRGGDHLSIASEGYVPFLAEAETLGAAAIWVHTHPGMESPPRPSEHDWRVDEQIADLFRLRSGSPYYGTLIFSPRPGGLTFSGYVQSENGPQVSIDRLWQVGDRFRLIRSFLLPTQEIHAPFDRNVRALGGAVQQTLSDLCVGVVGCGGTGSAVAEQLVRLGVRNLALFDPDELSASNVTRVYGSTAADVGKPKVDTLAAHLKRIAPDTRCDLVESMITMAPAARRLCACDIVFGCTDDNAGRLVLSRFSTYMLTPVIDSGVLVTSDPNGTLRGIDGRVTTLVPGQACLVCRGRIDVARAGAELLTPDERRRRVDEGYAPALGRTEPAVVTFTTLVAATAVSELLERLIGYGPEPRPSEVLLRCHDREISTNVDTPRARHYCDVSMGKLGIGITDPFLEQTWPA